MDTKIKEKYKFLFNINFFIFLLFSFLVILWCLYHIYFNSFIAVDGGRYFSLFDDAMISMRYGWNLANGNGLVWNVGERVEGITNTLMTLLMSFVIWIVRKKVWSVLAIQLLGIPIVVGISWITNKIHILLFERKKFDLINLLCLLSPLLYYPLIFWSINGMETGFLTLLVSASVYFALSWIKTNKMHDAIWLAISSGLAYLTRNDSAIFFGVIFVFITFYSFINNKIKTNLGVLIKILVIFFSIVTGLMIFRYFYYGELVPNTYALKVIGIPINVRIHDGIIYVKYFFVHNRIALFLWPLFFYK